MTSFFRSAQYSFIEKSFFDMMRITSHFVVLCVIFLTCPLILAGGCTKKTKGNKLTGTVTLDGEPLKEGVISFLDKATNEPDSAAISDGKYTANLLPGEKTVKITAQRVSGQSPRDPRDPGAGMDDVFEQYIHENYNTKTKLSYKMEDANAVQNFALTADGSGM